MNLARVITASLLLAVSPQMRIAALGHQKNEASKQDENNRILRDKLEAELRKDLNKILSKYKPPKSQKAQYEEAPEIETSYDKFEDMTAVTLKPMRIPHSIGRFDVAVAVIYKGRQTTTPEAVNLRFNARSLYSWFANDRDLIFLADGERLRLGATSYSKGIAAPGETNEFMSVTIPFNVFRQIAHGKNVEFKLGSIEAALRMSHLKAFRRVAGLPDSSPATPVQASADETFNAELEGTSWKPNNEGSSLDFYGDGRLEFGGRTGAWKKRGDIVEIFLPHVGPEAVEGVGVGIIGGDKLVVKISYKSLFVRTKFTDVYLLTQ